MPTNKSIQNKLKLALKNTFGTTNLNKIRKELKSTAKYEYGGYYIKKQIMQGADIYYTSNDNHFCTFGMHLQGVGITSSYALQMKDYTQAGRMRATERYVIF